MEIYDEGSIFYDYIGVTKYAQFKKVGSWAVVITTDGADLYHESIVMRKFSVLVVLMTITIISYFGCILFGCL